MQIHKKVYHQLHHHIKHHQKRYVRFVAFFIFLMAFAVIEDSIVAFVTGATFNVYTMSVILIVALTFTVISELTEKLVASEEGRKVKKLIRKEEKILRKDIRRI